MGQITVPSPSVVGRFQDPEVRVLVRLPLLWHIVKETFLDAVVDVGSEVIDVPYWR